MTLLIWLVVLHIADCCLHQFQQKLNLGKFNCLKQFLNFYCSLCPFDSQNIFLNPYQKFLKCVSFLGVRHNMNCNVEDMQLNTTLTSYDEMLTSYNETCLLYVRTHTILVIRGLFKKYAD